MFISPSFRDGKFQEKQDILLQDPGCVSYFFFSFFWIENKFFFGEDQSVLSRTTSINNSNRKCAREVIRRHALLPYPTGIEKNQKPGALQIRVIFMWKWKMEKSEEWRAKGRASHNSRWSVTTSSTFCSIYTHPARQTGRQQAQMMGNRYHVIHVFLYSFFLRLQSIRLFVRSWKARRKKRWFKFNNEDDWSWMSENTPWHLNSVYILSLSYATTYFLKMSSSILIVIIGSKKKKRAKK